MDVQVNNHLYPCTKCKRKFITTEFLLAHEQTHTSARPYECNVCHETFKQMMDMLMHQNTHEVESPHVNDLKVFKKLSENFHSPKQSSIKPPTNLKPLASVKSASKQRELRIIESGVRPYVCLTCDKQFKNKVDKLEHKCTQIVTGAQVDSRPNIGLKQLENNLVNKSIFESDSQIIKKEQGVDTSLSIDQVSQRKRRRYSNNAKIQTKSRRCHSKDFSCTKCSKQYTRMEHLRRHLLSHSGERKHVCAECKKKFTLLHQLKAHELTHTGERPYGCKKCNRRYTQLTHLITHQRVHTGERPYACTKCDKTFSDHSCLLRHDLMHTGEKSHRCTTCGRSFSTDQKLRRHELIHTGEFPYKCKHCEKQFRHKPTLVSHERVHSGECTHACMTCNKLLISASDLCHHEKIHKKEGIVERPYSRSVSVETSSLDAQRRTQTKKESHKCNVCAKSFNKPSRLHRHQLIHIRDMRRYRCSKCELRFSDKHGLSLHEQCHREEEDKILRASFMSTSSTVGEWRWSKGVCTDRVLTSLITAPVFICTSCDVLFRNRVSFDTHRQVSHVVTYACGICGDVSDSMTSTQQCFYSHPSDSTGSSLLVSDISSDIKPDPSLIGDTQQIEDTEIKHDGALIIGKVTFIEVKEEKSIFKECTNNNRILLEHSYGLIKERCCKVKLL